MSLWRSSTCGGRRHQLTVSGAKQIWASFSSAADPTESPRGRGRGQSAQQPDRQAAPGSHPRPGPPGQVSSSSPQQPAAASGQPPDHARPHAPADFAPSVASPSQPQSPRPPGSSGPQQWQAGRAPGRGQGQLPQQVPQQQGPPRRQQPAYGQGRFSPDGQHRPQQPGQQPGFQQPGFQQQQQQQQHEGVLRAPRQLGTRPQGFVSRMQQPGPGQADFEDAEPQLAAAEVQSPRSVVTPQRGPAAPGKRPARPQNTAGRGKLFAGAVTAPGDLPQAPGSTGQAQQAQQRQRQQQRQQPEERGPAGRGRSFPNLATPSQGPSGPAPGGRHGMEKEQLWEMTTQEMEAQAGRKLRLPHKPGFRSQTGDPPPEASGVGQNSRYPSFARGRAAPQEGGGHPAAMHEDDGETGFDTGPEGVEFGPIPDTRESRVRPLGHEDPEERDPPTAQELPPGGSFALFDEQDNNKRMRHLSKLPSSWGFGERGLDEYDMVETLADPRVNFNFGPPRLEDALPRVHPLLQMQQHKEALMASASLNEEEFEVAAECALAEYRALQATHKLVQPEFEGAKLEAMVRAELPEDHLLFAHVQQAVRTVLHNAGWGWPEKQRFAAKLISQSKRLTARHAGP